MNLKSKKSFFRIKARVILLIDKLREYLDDKSTSSLQTPSTVDQNPSQNLPSLDKPKDKDHVPFGEVLTDVEATIIVAFSYWLSHQVSAEGVTEVLFKTLEIGTVIRFSVLPIIVRIATHLIFMVSQIVSYLFRR